MLIKAWAFENYLSKSQWGVTRNSQVSQMTLKSQGHGLDNLLTSFSSIFLLYTLNIKEPTASNAILPPSRLHFLRIWTILYSSSLSKEYSIIPCNIIRAYVGYHKFILT